MTEVEKFDVQYFNQATLFFAGQVVNGRVLLKLNKDMKVNAVRLLIKGRAKVQWNESNHSTHKDLDGSDHYVHVGANYEDKEQYMDTELTLWGNQRGAKDEPPALSAGSYEWPFSFILPVNCQSSYESKKGAIRYYCKAVIDRPWKTNFVTDRSLTVASIVDLNLVTNVQLPQLIKNEKVLRGFMGVKKLGDYSWEMKLARTGFVPGEVFPFEICLNNNTSTIIEDVSVNLTQLVVYIANNKHTKTKSKCVFYLIRKNIQPNSKLEWINKTMRVPVLPPSCLSLCRVMRISYELIIKVNPAGIHETDCEKIPIFIGNVPLRSSMALLNQKFKKSKLVSGNAQRNAPNATSKATATKSATVAAAVKQIPAKCAVEVGTAKSGTTNGTVIDNATRVTTTSADTIAPTKAVEVTQIPAKALVKPATGKTGTTPGITVSKPLANSDAASVEAKCEVLKPSGKVESSKNSTTAATKIAPDSEASAKAKTTKVLSTEEVGATKLKGANYVPTKVESIKPKAVAQGPSTKVISNGHGKPSATVVVPLPADLYPDLPHPCYKEIPVKQKKTDKPTKTTTKFYAPLYLYYDWD